MDFLLWKMHTLDKNTLPTIKAYFMQIHLNPKISVFTHYPPRVPWSGPQNKKYLSLKIWFQGVCFLINCQSGFFFIYSCLASEWLGMLSLDLPCPFADRRKPWVPDISLFLYLLTMWHLLPNGQFNYSFWGNSKVLYFIYWKCC